MITSILIIGLSTAPHLTVWQRGLSTAPDLAVPEGAVTIVLPATVEVRGTELALGEIAQVSGEDVLDVIRVRELKLGYAPAPGYSRLFSRDHLATSLATAVPGVECTFAGSPACRVTPAIHVVTARELQAEAERSLRAALTGADVVVTLKGKLMDRAVPAAERTTELRASARSEGRTAGTWNVPVEILLDGEPYRTIWTTWTVEEWRTLPVLTRRVTRGEELTPNLFTDRRVRVGTGRLAAALDPAAFGRATAVRDLGPGSVVTERDVQRTVVVKRGDVVSLEVKKGAITARALAFAKQDGRVGDRVRVETASSSRIIIARVIAKDLVRIEIQ